MSQQVEEEVSTGGVTRLIINGSKQSTWVFFDRNNIVQTNPTMLTRDVPLQIVQPRKTRAPPHRVFAVRMWAEMYRSWGKLGMLVFAVLVDVLVVFSTGRDRAYCRFFVRLEVLARDHIN